MIEISPENLVELLTKARLAESCDYLDIRGDEVFACDIFGDQPVAACVRVDIENNERLLFPLFNWLVVQHYAAQARIDALMWEYCPDDMTEEQIEQYEKSQKRSEEDVELE